MSVIKNSPFESKYGFKSPRFSVDDQGNISATSITLATSGEDTGAADFIVTENETGTAFIIAGFETENPVITLQRTKTYIFSINSPNLTFSFYEFGNNTLYTTGVSHSDGTRDVEAVEKTSGSYIFRVPIDAPTNLTYRGKNDLDEFVLGQINITDPDGVFGELDITTDTDSDGILTGALTVAGGAGIAKNLYVGQSIYAEDLNLNGVGIPAVGSSTNLELAANFRIVFKIENNTVGFIDETGFSVPISNTTIDNTVIGSTIPSTANFVSASVTETPTLATNVANKNYVDQTALSLSIAFGL